MLRRLSPRVGSKNSLRFLYRQPTLDDVFLTGNEDEMLKQRKQHIDYNSNSVNKVAEPPIHATFDFKTFRKRSKSEVEEVDADDKRSSEDDLKIEVPPSNISSEPLDILDGETEEDAEIRRTALRSRSRTRSSTVVHIPTASIQMDLHLMYLENISPKISNKKGKSLEDPKRRLQRGVAVTMDEENEKKARKFAIFKQKMKKDITLDDFKDFLEHLRSNLVEVFQHDLEVYKDSHWSTISHINEHHHGVEKEMLKIAELSEQERERFEALWELFYAEISYLLDHLLVLQNVFAKPIEHAKNFGFLLPVNENTLFANLETLIEVISNFAEKLLRIFKNCGSSVCKSTEIIVEAFKEFDDLLTPQYNEYCLNYQKAKIHLNWLKEDELFMEYLKWSEQDDRCKRRRLEDFLVAPLQHLTKYPLLLKAVRKRTPKDDINNQLLTTTIFDIEQSIKSIEKKISSLVNSQRLQEIYDSVKWPAISDSDQKTNIPDFIRVQLNNSHCETILMNPNRILMQEGYLTLADNTKSEFYVFLFDDMLLVTKCNRKKTKRRYTAPIEMKGSDNDIPKKKQSIRYHQSSDGLAQFTVYRQPIPLDRLKLYDLDNQTSGFKNSFCVIHYNRYHQAVSIYTFQASRCTDKTKWVKNISQAKEDVIGETYSSSTREISSDEEYML